MKVVVYFLALFALVSIASAATIHGTIYDISLEKAGDVIVEINTEPRQQLISKDGTYSFNVPVGGYTIEAKHYVDSLLESSATEEITVKGEGDFVLDLILFPEIDSGLVDEADDINLDDDYFNGKSDYLLIVLIAVLVIVAFLVWYFTKRKKQAPQESIKPKDDYYDNILSIIKQNKRVTQKEIRKQIPLSEAKISLIIAELEHKGLIEKIKKGRGNIIILK